MRVKIRKTKKKRFRIGKHDDVVGVLLKNKQTQRHIQSQHLTLKQKTIGEIRKYLYDHHLLKIGSNAPPDVLRRMYEDSILTGEVKNTNDSVMLHNFMSGGGGLRGIVTAAALTAARTAAVSGAGLRAAPPTTERARAGETLKAAIIGGGVQAVTHRALLQLLAPGASVAFYSRRAASELPLLPGDRVASSVDDALSGADIIVTAAAFGTAPREISLDAITPGATLLVIDYATTISGALVAALRARGPIRVITDSASQFDVTRAAGKLGTAESGAWPAAEAQIGELLDRAANSAANSAANGAANATAPGAVTTLVNHLGISACDLVLADAILTAAEERGVGTLLPQ
jgi:ornithine cyclodeaminase/alanine dehydrogenase-like protein (mu-crystallin family)